MRPVDEFWEDHLSNLTPYLLQMISCTQQYLSQNLPSLVTLISVSLKRWVAFSSLTWFRRNGVVAKVRTEGFHLVPPNTKITTVLHQQTHHSHTILVGSCIVVIAYIHTLPWLMGPPGLSHHYNTEIYHWCIGLHRPYMRWLRWLLGVDMCDMLIRAVWRFNELNALLASINRTASVSESSKISRRAWTAASHLPGQHTTEMFLPFQVYHFLLLI